MKNKERRYPILRDQEAEQQIEYREPIPDKKELRVFEREREYKNAII
jgi:hypothetical protein